MHPTVSTSMRHERSSVRCTFFDDCRMIVEFVGCTSSGKTTLANSVRTALPVRSSVNTPEELVLQRWRLSWLRRGPRVMVDLLLLPDVVRSVLRDRVLISKANEHLGRTRQRLWRRVRVLRNLVRQLSLARFLDRRRRSWLASNSDGTDRRPPVVVLWDEGVVHTVHSIFVVPQSSANVCEVKRTLSTCRAPWPDLIICVDADLEVVVRRYRSRSDPAWPRIGAVGWAAIARHGLSLFRELASSSLLADRFFVVRNDSEDGADRSSAIDEICTRITSHQIARTRS